MRIRADFNPLPRKEGDAISPIAIAESSAISIHSLVKRETAKMRFFHLFFSISIHSLVKRETQKIMILLQAVSISIHSLVKRETHQNHV